MPETRELLRCPFCGGDTFRFIEVDDCGPDGSWTARVTCADCDADGPPGEDWHDTKDEAMVAAEAAWNRRSTQQA
jgi:Lar family restriction alleviation protein